MSWWRYDKLWGSGLTGWSGWPILCVVWTDHRNLEYINLDKQLNGRLILPGHSSRLMYHPRVRRSLAAICQRFGCLPWQRISVSLWVFAQSVFNINPSIYLKIKPPMQLCPHGSPGSDSGHHTKPIDQSASPWLHLGPSH